jgi:heat shock protein HtpX
MYLGVGPSVPGMLLAAGAGLVVFVLASGWSYYGGGQTLLRISGARPIDKADDPQLFNVVDELRLAAGLPMPRVYLIDSPALNAFATGRDADHAAVAITTGLRQKLSRDELAGVMAHELAHVRHLDIRMTMLVATLVGLIVLAAEVMWRGVLYGRVGGGRRGGGKGGGAAVIIIILIVAFLMIIAPLLAKVIQFAVSRQREYLADAGAVELTRYPKGLADALRKLAADSAPLKQANKATAHMYIVNPILNAKGRQDRRSVFSTHPPVTDRIARIEALLR